MKRRGGKSANMYVMFALLAVLFVSLGYLSMQKTREGMIHPRANKAAFRGGREGMETKEAGLDALPPAVKDALEAAKKAKETPK
jgi:hypothetical protein